MSRFTISRLLAPGLARPLTQTTRPTAATVPPWTRLFSQQASRQQDAPQSENAMKIMGTILRGNQKPDAEIDSLETLAAPEQDFSGEPYHFHIYSHKHNTHITLTKPNREVILSLSCGNLGFRKAGRKHYDSAYQLGAYVIDKMHQKNLVNKIGSLEVILRGFGQGREAVVKVLMGNEGKMLRTKITRVADSTRLKFGGTRSPRIRRLG